MASNRCILLEPSCAASVLQLDGLLELPGHHPLLHGHYRLRWGRQRRRLRQLRRPGCHRVNLLEVVSMLKTHHLQQIQSLLCIAYQNVTTTTAFECYVKVWYVFRILGFGAEVRRRLDGRFPSFQKIWIFRPSLTIVCSGAFRRTICCW